MINIETDCWDTERLGARFTRHDVVYLFRGKGLHEILDDRGEELVVRPLVRSNLDPFSPSFEGPQYESSMLRPETRSKVPASYVRALIARAAYQPPRIGQQILTAFSGVEFACYEITEIDGSIVRAVPVRSTSLTAPTVRLNSIYWLLPQTKQTVPRYHKGDRALVNFKGREVSAKISMFRRGGGLRLAPEREEEATKGLSCELFSIGELTLLLPEVKAREVPEIASDLVVDEMEISYVV